MASTLNPQSKLNSMQRVKVYCLDKDGKWDDRGTGHISMDYIEVSEELGLYVIDEDDNATLLVHRISVEDIYKKQEDTIISWRDPERSMDLALSFQEAAGCCYIWDQISNMQRSLNFDSLTRETFHNVKNELKELPDVTPSTLPEILKIVTERGTTDQMRLSELMLKDDLAFFQNLMKVFETCEKSKDVDGLHTIFNIVKGIISLNSSEILETILGDKLITKVIGCLEYDPSVPEPQHHRNYLEEHVVFKEAIPIKDPLLRSKIHQTYRMCYLKDVVLSRVLDGVTARCIDSVITAKKASVVTLLKNDSTFLKELFARLRLSTSAEAKKNLVHFLHEFCSLSSSNLQMQHLRPLFTELVNDGIFEIIADILQNPDKKLVLTGTDILYLFSTHDPNLLRSYVARPESTLLGHLVKRTMEDFGDEMECQFIEIIRVLLDSNALSVGANKMNIMDIFCEKHLPEIVDFITSSCPGIGSHCGTKPKVLLNICELLCLCLQQESFRTNFLDKNMTEKVLLLTRRKEKAVVTASIRVFRTLLSVLDDNVQSYVVKNNLMKPIIDVLVAPGNRNNMASSTVLELLEHIRKLNATVLLEYVVDTFWDQLTPFKHLSSIQAFKTNYEQCIGRTDPMMRENEDAHGKENRDEEQSASASNTHTEEEEAKPHDSNVEAEHSTSQSLRSGGLVDQTEASVSEEERQKNKTSPCKEIDQQEQSKRQRLCPIIEENKNSPEQGEDDESSSEMDVDGS